MMRMTKTSKANLLTCDSARIEPAVVGGFLVRLQKSRMTAYVSSSDSVLVYPTVTAARRAVKRIRPDLEPTTFADEDAAESLAPGP